MKKTLKKIYRYIIISFFHILYGKIKLDKKQILKKKINSFLFNKNIKYFFYEKNNVRIYTDSHENVSVIQNKKLIKELSYQQIYGKLVNSRYNEVLKSGTPKFLKKIYGSTLLLAQGASGYSNYSHWLLDILPRIKLFTLACNKPIDNIYLNTPNKFQRDTLKILGLKNINFVNSKKQRHIFVNKLFFCSHPNYHKGTIMEAHSKIPGWIIKYIRKKFLFKSHKKYKKKLKVFIDRSDSSYSHCKLINNDNVKKYLLSKGFISLKLGDLSFNKQVDIFNNSKVIIGPHGAGLANLIFCKRKTKVFEIKPIGVKNKVYQKISSLNNLNYKLIKLNKIEGSNKGDMLLDLKLLKKIY